MFGRIRAAPSLSSAAGVVLSANERAVAELRSMPVRRAGLISAFEETGDVLRGGQAAAPDLIRNEMAKFTSELLRSEWPRFSGTDQNSKVARAVSEVFTISHSQLLCLETLSEYGAFRDNLGELQSVALQEKVEDILSSARALGVEKFGVHPRLDVEVGPELRVDPAAIPLLEFAVIEILKNAFGAMIERYGALDVEDAPPVKIHLSGASQRIQRVLIEDFGTGMDAQVKSTCFRPLATTLVDDRDDPWKYSRTFGAKFAGAGLGAFRARLGFYHFGAEKVSLRTKAGVGTAVEIFFLEEAEKEEEGDLSKHTVVQLKNMLRGKGLKTSGRKAELVRRLEEAS